MKDRISLLCLCLLAWVPAASAQRLQIGGDPLVIESDERGAIGLGRMQQGTNVAQYYGGRAKGSALFLGGTNAALRWGSGAATFVLWDDEAAGCFSPVSHVKPDAQTVSTVLAAGQSGVSGTQTLNYVNGNTFYSLTWQIANRGPSTYRDLRFIHGGDVSPAGEDFARGFWDASSNMVYVVGSDSTNGFMGLQGDPSSPAAGYVEGHFQRARDAAKAGGLDNTVDAGLHDAAYALQWTKTSLAPGETWTIRAWERFAGAEQAATGVWQNVTGGLLHPLFENWVLNRQTGTYFGSLRLSSVGGQPMTGPFNVAIRASPDMRFMQPTGTLPDGRPYIDLTAAVQAAQPDGRLDPGDTVVIPQIEVYMKYRYNPPDSAFSVWATTVAPVE